MTDLAEIDANVFVYTEWLPALRSGEYEQVIHKLAAVMYRSENGTLTDGKLGYCCLGVACSLLTKEGVLYHNLFAGEDNKIKHKFGPKNDSVIGSEDSVLPPMVAEQLNISQDGGFKIPIDITADEFRKGIAKGFSLGASAAATPGDYDYNVGSTLTMLNDAGFTFSQIADVIEYCWRYGYFGAFSKSRVVTSV